jgi:hypothetical protein
MDGTMTGRLGVYARLRTGKVREGESGCGAIQFEGVLRGTSSGEIKTILK